MKKKVNWEYGKMREQEVGSTEASDEDRGQFVQASIDLVRVVLDYKKMVNC